MIGDRRGYVRGIAGMGTVVHGVKASNCCQIYIRMLKTNIDIIPCNAEHYQYPLLPLNFSAGIKNVCVLLRAFVIIRWILFLDNGAHQQATS